jgi:hypothetical protein
MNNPQKPQAATDTTTAITSGKFVTVTFVKNDGSIQRINGRTGVTKHLKGGKISGLESPSKVKYITIWDLRAKGYRNIRRDSILRINAEGFTVGTNLNSAYAKKIVA